MWLFTTRGFYSVVMKANDLSKVMVRARVKKDLENLIQLAHEGRPYLLTDDEKVLVETPEADYPYRMTMDRLKWDSLTSDLNEEIWYTNFKEQIKDEKRHQAYLDVWLIMRSFQDDNS